MFIQYEGLEARVNKLDKVIRAVHPVFEMISFVCTLGNRALTEDTVSLY